MQQIGEGFGSQVQPHDRSRKILRCLLSWVRIDKIIYMPFVLEGGLREPLVITPYGRNRQMKLILKILKYKFILTNFSKVGGRIDIQYYMPNSRQMSIWSIRMLKNVKKSHSLCCS